MQSFDLNELAKLLEELRLYSNIESKETLIGVTYEGNITDESINAIKALQSFINKFNLEDFIYFRLDDENEDWNEIDFQGSVTWQLSIGDKDGLLRINTSL